MQHIHLSKHLILESTTSIKDAEIIILGAPYDGTSTHYPGSRHAPYEIRREFLDLDKDKEKPFWDTVKFHDVGNIEVVIGDTKETLTRIEEVVKTIREKNPNALLITLGGEHLITLPVIKAQPEITNTIILDAHLDLKDDYMGVKESHATISRRIHELGKKITIQGYRSYTKEETDYAKQNNITIKENTIDYKTQADEKTHLSIDMDVLNPKEMPGVGNPQPGGITFNQLKETIKQITPKIKSIDFVETNPLLEKTSSITTAELLLETMISKI